MEIENKNNQEVKNPVLGIFSSFMDSITNSW